MYVCLLSLSLCAFLFPACVTCAGRHAKPNMEKVQLCCLSLPPLTFMRESGCGGTVEALRASKPNLTMAGGWGKMTKPSAAKTRCRGAFAQQPNK
jgi:hypothetical protein